MVSPAWCLACHQLGSQPLTTCGVEGRARHLQDVPVLERKPDLWAGEQGVLRGVVAEQGSHIRLGVRLMSFAFCGSAAVH